MINLETLYRNFLRELSQVPTTKILKVILLNLIY